MNTGLPTFPDFEKLSLNHKDLLQSIAVNFPSSDFNFAGLFTWDVNEVVTISNLNGNIVICTSDYLTHDRFYSFIGNTKVNETIQILTDYAEKNGEETKLKLITESVAEKIDQEKHKLIEDRDNFDYIFHVDDLINLDGGKHQKKRQKLRRFSNTHARYLKERELDLSDSNTIKDIEQVMTKWQVSRGKHIDEVSDEFVAIKKALVHHKHLGIRAFGVYHGDNLIAFEIFEILPGKIAMGHFQKADTKFEDVFMYLDHAFAKHLSKLGIEIYNTEQDLGVPGLRAAKESNHPARFIKKYTVERIK